MVGKKLPPLLQQMNPKELEILTKKFCILAPPKEADVKKIDLDTGDPEKTATISAHLLAK
jgi:hypothetical protein